MNPYWIILGVLACAVIGWYVHDRWISTDPILRNFPIFGHFRGIFIELGPKLRQYIVADDREELPFNRDERDWIYRSADGENNYFGFGTDDQILGIGYPVIKHAMFPHGEESFTGSKKDTYLEVPCGRTLGEVRDRERAWKPRSLVNTSAMSYGSLGAHATEALCRGAQMAGCYQNTGEGGISDHHRHGADLVWQIGTGYFGCRDLEGRFSMDRLQETLAASPTVRAIEIKLSQGAKPGKGGVLPGAKVTPEIARIRGIPEGRDCISPNSHRAFDDIPGLIRFVEEIANTTGLPVGIKSAIGHADFWRDLAREMKSKKKGPDFITIDGGEGGTGAAPMTFADHVSLPFRVAFPRVYRTFLEEKMADRVVWNASAKLGFPDRAIVAICLGADLVSIARESLLAIGCIQAQKCHTGRCPTGVTTHDRRLQEGLLPIVQAARFARYVKSFRNELLAITHACGYQHPGEFTADDVEISTGPARFTTLRELEGYTPVRSKKRG